MRNTMLALLALGVATLTEPASAQTYGGSSYPVCLHIYGPINYYDCGFSTIPQCQVSASGRSAVCELNPYVAQASVRRGKRGYRAYSY